ncbi:MAG: T9SS type A sorting domain-containing protein [Bacteroidota bacterium]|nr:T9SS type A sorting domain-containing protein [Bacteroidota bacterium]
MKRCTLLLVIMAIWSCSFVVKAQVLPSDSLALVDLYNSTGGPNWASQGGWLVGPVNTWAGVVVTNNRVTELAFECNNMIGTIPASIGNLTELTKLQLNGDDSPETYVDLHGTIPAELWNCTKLVRLQIKFTHISGPLPAGIEKLTALQEINFQKTNLGCEIPAEIFNLPSLTKAYLHQSNFIGKVPSTLVNATKLQRLYLQGNHLSAGLPFVALPAANAAKVELTGNYFTFADLKPYYDAKANLASLISDNQYARKTALIAVNAGKTCNLNGSAADGEAYAWFKNTGDTPIGTDSALAVTINGSADEGTYTCKAQSSMASGCNMLSVYTINQPSLVSDSLALVDLYNATGGSNWTSQGNWLTGPVSSWAGVVVTNNRVTELAFECNNMIGTIPASIGNLTELTKLQLNGDDSPETYVDLHGTVPAELWNCTKLNRLQIKFTNITGPLPAGIEKLTALQEINFQKTKLGCEIPAEIFNLPSLTKAYLHQSNFTGKVPSTLVNATKLQRLYLQGNNLSAGLPFVALPVANAAKVELTGNHFTFADLKPYYDAKSNLASLICDYQYLKDTVNAAASIGETYTMFGNVPDAEAFAWFKDAETVPISTDYFLNLSMESAANEGIYTCKAQSSMASGCTILATYKMKIASLESDSLTLVDIYKAAGGPNWGSQGNWLTTEPLRNWSGVTMSGDRVTELSFKDNNMTGTMSPSIGNLTELTRLDFNGNDNPVKIMNVQGTVPGELWNCSKLTRLQIKFTNMTGPLPEGIEKLSNLSEINFQMTKLNCEIPSEIFNIPTLTKAYLHQSNFIGKVPSTVANATKLQRLYLQGNHLSSGLPYVEIPAANAAKVELTGNYFTFADVKPYYDAKANYAGFICDYQYAKDTVVMTVNSGVKATLEGQVTDGEAYAWFKNAETTPVGTDPSLDVTLNSVADEAVYTCKAQSSSVSGCNMLTVYKLKLATGLNNAQVMCAVYPNPVSDRLFIQSAKALEHVAIYDLTGKSVLKVNGAGSSTISLPVDKLNKGVYMVVVKTADTVATHKIVKE